MEFTRTELRSLHSRSTVAGLAVFTLDLTAFLGCSLCSLMGGMGWRVGLASAAGLFMSLLFVVGHDACHQALTPRRWLNRAVGTLAFVPSLHAFSLWDLAHNRIHHRFTNRRGLDYVWEPLSPGEYLHLSQAARIKYRFYRTPAGHLFYYLCEVWWRKLFWPRRSVVGRYRVEHAVDLMLVTAWLVAWPLAIALIQTHFGNSQATVLSVIVGVAISAAIPFLVFNALMSAVIFLHHIHPAVAWHRADDPIDQETLQRRSAVHIIFPWPVNWVFHRIMEHTAHHLRPGIPLYRLLDAQTLLESKSDDIVVQHWSIASHLQTLARCKLYDIDRRCWTDYGGIADVPTALRGCAVGPDVRPSHA